MTSQDIVRMLAQADHAARRAEDACWRGKTTEYYDDADRQFEREREYANEARRLRAQAWALVQADPSLKPDGVEVPEVYMPEPVVLPMQSRLNALLAERWESSRRTAECYERLLAARVEPKAPEQPAQDGAEGQGG